MSRIVRGVKFVELKKISPLAPRIGLTTPGTSKYVISIEAYTGAFDRYERTRKLLYVCCSIGKIQNVDVNTQGLAVVQINDKSTFGSETRIIGQILKIGIFYNT